MDLNLYGWDSVFETQLTEEEKNNFIPGRITTENKTNYKAVTGKGEIIVELSGRLIFTLANYEFPKVGDWVLINYFDEDKGIIERILKRKTKLSRKVPGIKIEEQILAANIDCAVIVQPVDLTYNFNRLQRILTAARQNNLGAVIVLSKSDLCSDIESILKQINSEFPDQKISVTSTLNVQSFQNVMDYLIPRKTYILVGVSGAGKSTLINNLFGKELLRTQEVRSYDGKGKHTTTRRELFLLPNGSVLVDSPGIREFQLWEDENNSSGLTGYFGVLEEECKFNNCSHLHEKGCAIIEAVKAGKISEVHYKNYQKMKKEIDYLNARQDQHAQLERKRKRKQINKEIKRYFNLKNRKGF